MSEEANRSEVSHPRLALLWQRLSNHRVAQWTVGYVAVAYGIQHAVILTSESYEWPNIVARATMTLLVLGIPLVMTLAWYHGNRANRHTTGGEMAIVSVMLVGLSLAFYLFIRPAADVASRAPAAQEASVITARAAASNPRLGIAVAVMPFANLSGDKDQEYFSDGMTDEISGALAKIPDLSVVARSSAFQFKGKDQDARAIGQQLHATHLIEGSVRKSGDQLRISAQVVKADDGVSIWSNSYDRQLKDVFAVQEDIARAIATSLHMTLGLKPGEYLVNNRKIDAESYDKFLRAKALLTARVERNGGATDSLAGNEQATSLLEAVVAGNPDYAPAWAYLGLADFLVANIHAQEAGKTVEQRRVLVAELREKGEAAAQTATRLDPQLGSAYVALALFTWSHSRLLEADALFNKASSLDSTPPAGYSLRLATAGYVKEALVLSERTLAEEPFDPQVVTATAEGRWLNGDDAGAIALANGARPASRGHLLALVYASEGHFREAADALDEIAGDPNSAAANAARLLRIAPAKIPPGQLPALPAGYEFVYLYVGTPERALTSYQRRLDADYFSAGVPGRVWHPSFAPARKTPLFKTLMRKAGLVDYWRKKGWPPQCHPTTGDDFECS